MAKAQTVALPPRSRIERFGLEAVPQELRKTRWYEYVIIQIAFSVNAGNFLVPALAVIQGGLNFYAAFLSTIFGATLAFLFVSYLSLPGAERGIPSQFAIRSIIGIKGSRYISSPIRTVTSLYWFSVQTIGGTLVIQFILERTFQLSIPFYIIAMLLALIMSGLALVGFDAVKRATKYFMPWLILGQLVMLYLLLTKGTGMIGMEKTMEGAWNLPVMGFFASLAFVQYVSGVSSSADVTRYAVTSKQGFWGLFTGNVLGFILTAFFGAYTAQLTGAFNPFIATSEMTNSGILTAIILGAAILSMVSINLSNAYTGGFSLLNSLPLLGRVKSSMLFGAAGILLSLSPALVEEAERYISLIGAFVIPLSAVIITDFLLIKRKQIEVSEGLPSYNRIGFVCIGIGIGVYLLLPEGLSPGFLAFLITSTIYFFSIKKSQK
ncbi:purine-cytosine permease family protein [Sutcliffiella horikoshii]|uniref:purine-cytosine permease family protein n=1 Tax=Sutcliffiella horikoshii TaxID=79883 RepID=UPI001CFCF1E9|nr:cytosine permease [Sutcliffiella horikoshii]